MNRFHNDDLAKLIVRITCAGLLILHGPHSHTHGIQHIKDMVRSVAFRNLLRMEILSVR